ncbi:MAG TPA: DUF3107 domain-containing protein [Actinomycetes bacterium]|nr:DUF3107 domain-containing protein [Actinomycetes bacterium]
MEIKIGVNGAPRELVVDSSQTAEEVVALVEAALASEKGLLVLEDARGRQVLVPVDKLGYVEVGEPEARRVGFGAL